MIELSLKCVHICNMGDDKREQKLYDIELVWVLKPTAFHALALYPLANVFFVAKYVLVIQHGLRLIIPE